MTHPHNPHLLRTYPQEARQRAERLVLERRGEYETEWAELWSTSGKSGYSAETLRVARALGRGR